MSAEFSRVVGKKIADRYCITAEIGRGSMGRVFKALSFDDPSRDVAIKIIQRQKKSTSGDLERFQKEASLMSRLYHRNIISFFELGVLSEGEQSLDHLNRGYYIVMEYAEGKNLKEIIDEGKHRDLNYALSIVKQLSAALDYTHGKNIIHRDIKPQNIIISETEGARGQLLPMVKMLDFGVARLAEAVNYNSDKSKRSSFDVAGTPLYMAPEQSSQTGPPADHRADLYSLGCVFYEMLLGHPPFQADSREQLESMHSHLIHQSVAGLRKDLPLTVSKVIDKLLAKSPLDRYQSAFSLMTDLDFIEKDLITRSGETFKIGRNDTFNATPPQIHFIGREQYVEDLLSDYEKLRSETARSRLTIIHGESGIGKTRLLSEFKSRIAMKGVRFIGANFNQHENSLPFNALANGLNDYLSVLSKTEPIQADELRRKIKTMLGQTASIISSVVPGLRPFLPEGITPTDFVLTDATFPLFSKVFSDFTKCLAFDENPVMFIFDDLHWADQKSLLLIDQFFSLNNSQRFFLVISSRPDEPGLSPWFSSFLEKFRKLKRRFRETHLEPLTREDVYNFASNMLSYKARPSRGLIDFLENSAGGKPMYLIELIRTLVRRDLLSLSQEGEGREIILDMHAIDGQPIILSSVDIALDRLHHIGGDFRIVMEGAATYGLVFHDEILKACLIDKSLDVDFAIGRALEEGLIAPTAVSSDLTDLGAAYSFVHWQAREVLYSQMGPSRRREVHGRIAQKLGQISLNQSARVVFAVAHHDYLSLDHGRTVSVDQALKSIKIACSAGRVARQSGAWQSAETYFLSAQKMASYWDQAIVSDTALLEILENIADLAVLQRKNGLALQTLGETMKLRLGETNWFRLAAKTIYVRLISGQVTSNDQSIKRFFSKIGRGPTLKNKLWLLLETANLYAQSRLSFLASRQLNKDLSKALKCSKLKSEKTESNLDFLSRLKGRSSFFAMCAQFYATQDLKAETNAVVLANREFRRMKSEISVDIFLRFLVDRSIYFAKIGGWKSALNQLDGIESFTKMTKNVPLYNYIKIVRQMWMLNDPKRKTTKSAFELAELLDRTEYRLLHISAMEHEIYQALVRGDFPTVNRLMHLIPYSIPTRHWLSVRSMAMSFFALLLTESRSYLASVGEEYLRRRLHVSARRDDVFSLIIFTVVAFARGEQGGIRDAYTQFVGALNQLRREPGLAPFEEEFLILFAMVFPLMFEKEYNRLLMRNDEMAAYSKIIGRKVRKLKRKNGGVYQLLLTKSLELINPNSRLKNRYQRLLSAEEIVSKPMFYGIALLWSGRYLIGKVPKIPGKLIIKSAEVFSNYGYASLEAYADSQIERAVPGYQNMERSRRRVVKTGRMTTLDDLQYYHLEHLAAIMDVARPLSQLCEESSAVFQRFVGASNVFVFKRDDLDNLLLMSPVVLQEDEEHLLKKITDFVRPYSSVDKVLLLPGTSSPWNQSGSKGISSSTTSNERNMPIKESDFKLSSTGNLRTQTSVFDNEVTIRFDLTEGTETRQNGHLKQAQSGANLFDPVPTVSSGDARVSLSMNAVVPIYLPNGESIGLIYADSIESKLLKHIDLSQKLAVFGAQVGLIFNQHDPSLQKKIDFKQYNASVQLEPCPWLHLWSRGSLRSQREHVWYLGFNCGVDQYLLFYCRVNGDQEKRDLLGKLLWYEAYLIRSTMLSNPGGDRDPQFIKNRFENVLQGYGLCDEIEEIALAFSLFDKSSRTISSGHFGPSRPANLFRENHVVPENKAVCSLLGGKELRYWQVFSNADDLHLYVLAHLERGLTPKLSSRQWQALRQLFEAGKVANQGHEILEMFVLKEQIPRYYVGAIMSDSLIDDEKARPA